MTNLDDLFEEASKVPEKKKFEKKTVSLQKNQTYKLRLILRKGEDRNLFTKIDKYSWTSSSSGKKIFLTDPRTGGKYDTSPLAVFRSLHWDAEKDRGLKKMRKDTKYCVLAFIVQDTATPENEGKRLFVDLPKTVKEFIETEMARKPEDDAYLGKKMFDTGKTGYNLILEVKTKKIPGDNGKEIEVPDYAGSMSFARNASALPGIDADAAKALYDDVPSIFTVYTPDKPEICADYLKEHFNYIGRSDAPAYRSQSAPTGAEDTDARDSSQEVGPDDGPTGADASDDNEAEMIARIQAEIDKKKGKK